jgi:hypothetical protein
MMSVQTSLEINLMDLEEQMRSVNNNCRVSDERWDSIIKELNSDFPMHNARPEEVGALVQSTMSEGLSKKMKGLSRWRIIELGGIVSAVIGITYLVSLAIIEVVKYIGG